MDGLVEIGRFGKPHGINGEINALTDVDLQSLRCIVVDVDGIDVPFFINSQRRRNHDILLIKIDGCASEQEVKMFVNKPIMALADDPAIPAAEELDPDADGFYASDFIGFKALNDSDGSQIGTITDIDDNTANVLFVVKRPDSPDTILIPVADEFITGINVTGRTITLSLPEGLID